MKQFLFNQSRLKRYYYHRDHQNSIIALSDKDAKIVEYYEYDTPDLYYYRARYYDPLNHKPLQV